MLLPQSKSELLAACSGLLCALGLALMLRGRAPTPPTPSGLPAAPSQAAAIPLGSPPDQLSYAEQLRSLLNEPPGPLRNQAMQALLGSWAEADGLTAWTVASSFEAPALRADLRETVLQHWAKINPQAAWAFVTADPNHDLPPGRFDQVLSGLGQAEIGTALTFLDQSKWAELDEHLDAASAALDELYQRGGHGEMQLWVEHLPTGPLKSTATERFINQWASYDPPAAASWVEALLARHPDQLVSARLELTQAWTRVNPLQALDYVSKLPAAQQENAYYEVIFKRWMEYDQKAAANYLAEVPAHPALDRPIENYAYEVMDRNPADTMPWVESISDPRRRWKALQRVAALWREQDPEALNTYLAGADYLDEAQKAQLLTPSP